MHVFTYGSLMFPEVWQAVVGRNFATIPGTSKGYSIFRVRNEVFPGIVPAGAQCQVEGLVHLDVDGASLTRIDRFEDRFYERLPLSIYCADGITRPAQSYVVAAGFRHGLTAEPWTAEWFSTSGGLAHFIARFQGFSRPTDDA